MTKQQIEDKITERIKEGTLFSRAELRRAYFKNYSQMLSDPILALARRFDVPISNPRSKLYTIFQHIKSGKRFLEKDVIWLVSKDFLKPKNKLSIEYHSREANFYLDAYSKNNNLWNIINASSHFRKANNSTKAIELINDIHFKNIKEKHLKSALIITQGGAYRDLRKFDEALKNAQKGYSFDSTSYYPCTLYGAVYYDIGKLSLGTKWFTKAIENGATTDSIDSEIRSIYKRAKGDKKTQLKNHLLKIDSYRYSWVKKL